MLQFDHLKTLRPAVQVYISYWCFTELFSYELSLYLRFPPVQNDFSFFRRNMGKMADVPGVTVQDTEADRISMFIAVSVVFN